MGCASCAQNKGDHGPQVRVVTNNQQPYPLMANDIKVVENNEIARLNRDESWNRDKHILLIFIPETFTPVCETELGAINKWYDAFQELDCEIIAAGTDQAGSFVDWYSQEPLLANPRFRTFSSYLLPSRLGIIENGRVKRASVFITKDGEVVKQEHFNKVGRSFAELHRMMYGYTTDSYCAEGWKSPEDGFLEKAEE